MKKLIFIILAFVALAGYSQSLDSIQQAEKAYKDSVLKAKSQELLYTDMYSIAQKINIAFEQVNDINPDSLQLFMGRYTDGKMYIMLFDKIYKMPYSRFYFHIPNERQEFVDNLGIKNNIIDVTYSRDIEGQVKIMGIPFPSKPVPMNLPEF